jgi:peptidoglycan/LPS O-acetylase OafA/YrhL
MANTETLQQQNLQVASTGAIRFEALDSWRGVCALLVAAFHFPLAGALSQNALVRGSFLFVDFFFVLSGFVFAHAYGARLSSGTGLGGFLITRFGRLVPLHLFMLLVLFVLELVRWQFPELGNGNDVFAGRNTLGGLLASILMVHSAGVTDQLIWNTPSWSISAEMLAYILFGCMLVLARGGFKILAAFIALVSLIILYRYGANFIEETHDLGAIRCFFGFSIGLLTHSLYLKAKARNPKNGQGAVVWTIVEVVTITAVIWFVSYFNAGVFNLLAPIVFAVTVLVFARESGLISKVLLTKPLLYLGTISYSIYLTHLTIQASLYALARYAHMQFGWTELTKLEIPGSRDFTYSFAENFALVALMFVLTIIMSSLTYRYIERPSRAWFRNFAAARAGRVATPATGTHRA